MATGKIALVMGVANSRSIAWSCVETFARNGWKVILTCQNEKLLSRAQPLLQNHDTVIGGFECDVLTDLEEESAATSSSSFQQRLADLLKDERLGAVVHSLAYGPNIKTTPLLHSTKHDFLQAHEISAYSLIQVARQVQGFWSQNTKGSACGSITTLSYLGAGRAVPGYHAMGPAKASLESIVRGLALELAAADHETNAARRIRVNAVSAGPLPTLSAKGGISGFDTMRNDVAARAPLGNITADQVASTVHFLSSDAASGITGQVIFCDGGYSMVG